MSFDIREFSGVINGSNGLARPKSFYVLIPNPPWLGGASGISGAPDLNVDTSSTGSLFNAFNLFGGDSSVAVPGDAPRMLSYMCHSTSLPGVTFSGQGVKRYGIGPDEFYPLNPVYDDQTLQFYVDGSGKVLQFFQRWMQNIININSNGADNSTSVGGAYPFEIYYKDNYTTNIDIIFLNEMGDSIIDVQLIDAFPVALSPINLSWLDTDSVAVLPVTFKYRNWKSTLFDASSDGSGVDRGFSLMSALIQAGSIATMISTMKNQSGVALYTNLYSNANLLSKNFSSISNMF